MSRILPEAKKGVLELTITGKDKDGVDVDIRCEVKLTRSLKLTVVPELFKNRTNKIDKSFSAIDYSVNPSLYRIKDQTYLGTVSSLITDNTMDIYNIKRTYKDENDLDVDEQFILLIPTLLLLGKASDMMLIDQPYKTYGMIAMVRNSKKHGEGEIGGYYNITANESQDHISTYLKDQRLVVKNELSVMGMSLSGMSNFDSVVNTLHMNNTDKSGSILTDKIGLSQFLLLGNVRDLFPDEDVENNGIDLDISRFNNTGLMRYGTSDTSFIKVYDGTLAVSLDI